MNASELINLFQENYLNGYKNLIEIQQSKYRKDHFYIYINAFMHNEFIKVNVTEELYNWYISLCPDNHSNSLNLVERSDGFFMFVKYLEAINSWENDVNLIKVMIQSVVINLLGNCHYELTFSIED